MRLALLAIRIVFVRGIIQHILQMEGRLNSQAPRAGYHVVSLEEPEGVVETLLAHIA